MFAQWSMKVTSTAVVACSEAAHLAPWQGEPRIGWELTLRATLSLHHKQKHALFKRTKESQIDQGIKEVKIQMESPPLNCERSDLNKGTWRA